MTDSYTGLNEGEEYDVEIEDIGDEGDGIARVDGVVVIVPEVELGDKVKIKINKVLKTLAFADVIEEMEE